jgi:hypothetical protein
MAVNVQVYDLQNYPDNNKTVTVDIKQVTPIGYEGDEQWVVSATTTAYSDIAARTAISDIFILEMKGGWAKSSGLKTSPFDIDPNSNGNFWFKLDADSPTPTGTDIKEGGSENWWQITLTSSGIVSGDDIAVDMENLIRALADHADMDATYALSYMNASVEFSEDKFKIISGSISESYTGATQSAVHVYGGFPTDGVNETLGFDIPISSYDVATDLASFVKESKVATGNYTAGNPTLNTDFSGSTTASGYAFYIDDGINNEYFLCIGGTADTMSVYTAVAGASLENSYDAGAKVQKIAWQDPDVAPINYYQDVDASVRWSIKSLANQIDYSS